MDALSIPTSEALRQFPTMFTIDINNQQSQLAIDAEQWKRAVASILTDAGLDDATINIAVVDDRAFHDLNRRFLDHDEPTDVLSFILSEAGARLEGDVIVSADTACRAA